MRELAGECPNPMAMTRVRGTVGQPGRAAEGAGQSDRESLPSVRNVFGNLFYVGFCQSLSEFVISRITRGSSVYIHQGLCLTEDTSSSARHVSHFAASDTLHEHSFLTFSGPAIFNNTALIHDHMRVALLRNYHNLQVMSPTELLTTKITCISPKTVRSLNFRSYVSNSCPSTSRS